MPLSKAQKETIESAIAHLIDVPTDEASFKSYQESLFKQFKHEQPANEDTELLINVFDNPCAYIKNLENLGQDITVGDVQAHMLYYITKQMEMTGHPITDWNQDAILSQMTDTPAFQARFETIKEQPEEIDFFALPDDPNALFTAHIGHDQGTLTDDLTHQQEVLLWPYVLVKLTWMGDDATTFKLRFPGPILSNDIGTMIDQFTYITQTKRQAYSLASIFALQKALAHLKGQGITLATEQPASSNETSSSHSSAASDDFDNSDDFDSNDDFDETSSDNEDEHQFHSHGHLNPAIALLVTHRFYFDLLLKRDISFSDISALDPKKAVLFLEPGIVNAIKSNLPDLTFNKLAKYNTHHLSILSKTNVIELIKNQILTVKDAFSLKENTLALLDHPTYYNLIYNAKIRIDNVHNINHEQVALLMIPFISHLIEQGELSIADALTLPYHCKPVLMNATINQFYKRGIITLSEIAKLSEEQCTIITLPHILNHLSESELTVSDIIHIPNECYQAFLNEPHLGDWLKKGYFELDDIRDYNPAKRIQTYMKGLAAALHDAARHTKHPETDLPTIMLTLKQPLASIASTCQLSPNELLHLFSAHLTATLMHSLDKIDLGENKATLEPHFSKLLNLMKEKLSSSDPYWVSTYDEAGQLGTAIIKKIRMLAYNSVSSNNKNVSELFKNEEKDKLISLPLLQVKHACHALIIASSLIATLMQLTPSRMHAKPL